MKTYRKILSFALAALFMLSLAAVGGITAFAAEESGTVTLYFDCPVDEVQNSTVYGIYGFSIQPKEYYESTLDERGLYVLEVPCNDDLESLSISFQSPLWQEMNIFAYSYNYDSISDVRLLEGLVLGGFHGTANLEPEFVNGVWCDRSTDQIIGDVDNDGELSVKDATFIQKCLASTEDWEDVGEVLPSGLVRYVADFNLDGVRDIRDASLVQKYAAYY